MFVGVLVLTASIIATHVTLAILRRAEVRHAKLRRAKCRRWRAQRRRWRRQWQAERDAASRRLERMLVGVGRN